MGPCDAVALGDAASARELQAEWHLGLHGSQRPVEGHAIEHRAAKQAGLLPADQSRHVAREVEELVRVRVDEEGVSRQPQQVIVDGAHLEVARVLARLDHLNAAR